jgi:hypothetical protein
MKPDLITTTMFKWAAIVAGVVLTMASTSISTQQLATVAAGLFVSAALFHNQEQREKSGRGE